MSKAFWRGFWEGLNPLFGVAWALYGSGHCVSLLLRFNAFSWFYPMYSRLMLLSCEIQDRFGFSGPWEPRILQEMEKIRQRYLGQASSSIKESEE